MPKKAHSKRADAQQKASNPYQSNREELRRVHALHGIQGPQAKFDQAVLSLWHGRMPQAWDEYEIRLKVPGLITPQRHFTHPRWDGKPFPGKTLLLHYEQGLGDTLMFVRYAPLVKAMGGTVLLAAQAPLADLVATCPGIDLVIPKGTAPPPFDFHLPLPSLPSVFRTDLASIPAEIPYLEVPEWVPHRQEIRTLVTPSEGSIRVGLNWTGSPANPRDLERSIPPAILAPLMTIPHVAWFGFQREAPFDTPFPGLLPLGPLLSTFSDTAYALSALDLVITVDTAVAHLAGAMGIPVLLLVTHTPDWRWLLDREDSPWYPTVRLYRQPSPGDWGTVVQRILRDLTQQG